MATVEVTFEKIYRTRVSVEVPDGVNPVDCVMDNGDSLASRASGYRLEEINVRTVTDMNGETLYAD